MLEFVKSVKVCQICVKILTKFAKFTREIRTKLNGINSRHNLSSILGYKFDKRHFSSVSTANAGFDNPRIAAVSALKIHSDFTH